MFYLNILRGFRENNLVVHALLKQTVLMNPFYILSHKKNRKQLQTIFNFLQLKIYWKKAIFLYISDYKV